MMGGGAATVPGDAGHPGIGVPGDCKGPPADANASPQAGKHCKPAKAGSNGSGNGSGKSHRDDSSDSDDSDD
jgi:hypothetical protein